MSFEAWDAAARELGWVHTHDDLVVLDDAESGECIGEFDDKSYSGWIYTEFLNRRFAP